MTVELAHSLIIVLVMCINPGHLEANNNYEWAGFQKHSLFWVPLKRYRRLAWIFFFKNKDKVRLENIVQQCFCEILLLVMLVSSISGSAIVLNHPTFFIAILGYSVILFYFVIPHFNYLILYKVCKNKRRSYILKGTIYMSIILLINIVFCYFRYWNLD